MRTALLIFLSGLMLFAELGHAQDQDTVVAMQADSISSDTLPVLDSNVVVHDTLTVDSSAITEAYEEIQIVQRNVHQKAWVFFLFIFILIVIGITRSINLKKHKNLLFEMTKLRTTAGGYESYANDLTAVNVLYLAIHILTAGFIFHEIYDFQTVIDFDSGFRAFLFTIVIVTMVYVVKIYIYRIVLYIIGVSEMLPVVVAIHSTLAYLFSVIVYPLMVVSYYIKSPSARADIMMVVGLVAVVYLIYRFFKLYTTLASSFTFPRIYLFLYLCTLEILPLLVAINVLDFGWV